MGKRKQAKEPSQSTAKKSKGPHSAFLEHVRTACKALVGQRCVLGGTELMPRGDSDVSVDFPILLSLDVLSADHFKGGKTVVVNFEYDSILESTDDLKYVYFHKKQVIMSALAKQLHRNYSSSLSASFMCEFEERRYQVCFGIKVSEDFKFYRLAPSRMNVLNEKKVATPIYNSLILRDIHHVTIDSFIVNSLADDESANECVKLLAAFYYKMFFSQYAGMLDMTAILSLFCHYYSTNEALRGCETMQLFKGFLTFLSTKNWSEAVQIGKFSGLLPSDRKDVFSLKAFKAVSQVVIIDPSGTINLAVSADIDTLRLCSHFVKCLLDCLNCSRTVSLESLIVEKCSDFNLYDFVINVDISGAVPEEKDILYNPDMSASMAKKTKDLVSIALKERILFVTGRKIDSQTIQLLLKLDIEKCFGLVEYGPAPDDTKAVEEFKALWGQVAGLRKFPNGNVQFAVAWPELASKRHMIIPTAIKQLLKHHKISEKVSCLCDNLDFMLEGQCETKPFSYFMEAFDNLSSLLRSTTKLPLGIVQVVPLSDTLRYTCVFPTIVESRVAGRQSPVSEAILIFEKSSKWPEDLQAIKSAKHAFLLQVQKILEQDHRLPCSIDIEGDFLDVFFKSLVFRLRIRVEREMVLMEREGLLEEHRRVVHVYEERPLFHAKIHALACQNPVFGSTVRMVKRWAASQLFSFVPEDYFDAMTAIAFTDYSLGSAPGSVISGFHRTLSLMADHPANTPFVFDPDHQLDANTLRDIQKDTSMSLYCSFLKNRKYNVPYLMTAPVWKQLTRLAKATIQLFETETDFTDVLVPVLADYMHTIKIDPLYNNSVLVKRDKKAAECVDKTIRKAAAPMADFVKSLPGLVLIQSLAEKIHKDHGVVCYHDKYSGDLMAVDRKAAANMDFSQFSDLQLDQ